MKKVVSLYDTFIVELNVPVVRIFEAGHCNVSRINYEVNEREGGGEITVNSGVYTSNLCTVVDSAKVLCGDLKQILNCQLNWNHLAKGRRLLIDNSFKLVRFNFFSYKRRFKFESYGSRGVNMSNKKTKSPTSQQPTALTPIEKANLVQGFLDAHNFRALGDNYPRVYAQEVANNPLPGEPVYENPMDNPDVKRLEKIVEFKKFFPKSSDQKD